ncbi:AMP-binding protein [Pontibacterium sp. N1Y112]|uniref:Long-chain-fatty-acid--CoA ligase n=1 Tax=Pontibacterium sinense TaxID=2781979 RepID=A0A8J7JZU3_9GAMM|nr:AMP-binding protein [Pontibacterium sinense]MBE9398129.1 AMP-binding protein [Pontibacterium sinense]
MTVERGHSIPEAINPQGFKNVTDIAAWACSQYADKPAFTSLGRTLSFQELDELADAFAVYLQSNTNLEPGDRIAVQLPNIVQYPVVLLGAMRAGLVVVNTNPLYTTSEMQHQFCDSGAKALVIHKSMARNAEQILDETEIETVFVTQVGDLHSFLKRVLINATVKYVKKMEPPFNLPQAIQLFDALDQCLGQIPVPVEINSEDIAVLQYTGGTTGVSKGAMLTHANLVSNVLQTSDRINAVGDGWQNTVIAPLPLYHIYAFTLAQIVLLAGGHSVLIPNPRDMPGFIKELGHWQTSTFLGLNTLFVGLCNQPAFADIDFSHLRMTVSGGMALTHAAAEQWEQATGCSIMEGYGLTETSPVVSVNPYGGIQVGTIGLPLLETEIKVIDADGVTLPTEQPGELCVRGPQVMKGYWHKTHETEAVFTADGYLRTGDVAVLQQDGYLRIVDRAKDMIITSGFNVYPSEVEDVICDHPEVLECAVIGVPDAVCGEAVKAFVVSASENLSQETLQKWCHSQLTGYKIPKSVEFSEELPKTNVGKVLRRKLRENHPQ